MAQARAHGARASERVPGEGLLDGRLAARASFALASANARYWPTVAPVVGAELRRWREHAREIPDVGLRELALEKLRGEHFNAQVAATLATRTPWRRRRGTIRAIVALEVMYDYLDGLTERLAEQSLEAGSRLFGAFADALAPRTAPYGDHYGEGESSGNRGTCDGGYLRALCATVRGELWRLPSVEAIVERARETAASCGEGQLRMHATPWEGDGQLREWALRQAPATGLGWREFLAGAAASVLTLHALLVAGSQEGRTAEQAERIADTYLCICALSTMLDSLVDREQDATAGELSYLRYFAGEEELGASLTSTARRGVELARQTPDEAHHVMILTGVVAYYTSAPAARREPAWAVARRVQGELWPAMAPTMATMRAWRLAKGARAGLRWGSPAGMPAHAGAGTRAGARPGR
jgi:tetraprenyl-beta-curcumene synthase